MKHETAVKHLTPDEPVPEETAKEVAGSDDWMTPVPAADTAIEDLTLAVAQGRASQAQLQIKRLEKITKLLVERACADFPTNMQREENRKAILKLAEEMK